VFLDAGAGLGVMAVILIFIVILAIGLLYDIKKGGLEFD
jgi:NADH-quinone oxidoreductase subunit A